ncbi:RNA polymerase sigma factor [Sunxiuqinia sp. sy24]|uniref:RNA polymerase sigma factor n=1 Tax=Sunxiuqinia sp. sy24 TaxID=3461495 RepID=UPI00404680CB
MKNQELNIEKQLIRDLKEGHAKAFDQLFTKYGKRLFFFSLGYLKSEFEAEEVVQEVFYKIWKNRKSVNPDLSFKAYLFKIAFNHIQELFQKLNLQKAYQHEIINTAIVSSNELDSRTNYQSLLELVNKLIDQLPPRQKEILIRKRQHGQAINEIAKELNISSKTVENHITEALKKLKKGLSAENTSGLLYFHLFINNHPFQ